MNQPGPNDAAGPRTSRGPLTLSPRHDHAGAPRAWDAADDLLLAAVQGTAPAVVAEDLEELLPDRSALHGRAVVAEERHGALTAAWDPVPVGVVVDSWSSERAALANLLANGGDPAALWWRTPLEQLPQPIELLVLRPGRDNARLGFLLEQVAPRLAPDAVVLGSSMVHHLHRSTLELIESTVGPTRTTRAHRRARLLVARPSETDRTTPAPTTFDARGMTVVGWPGVFGATGLDPGAQLLLSTLPPAPDTQRAIDLCCGTGVLATALAHHCPDSEVLAVDDSAIAVDAARRTFAANGCPNRVRAVQGDVLTLRDGEVPDGSVDLVVCNPPFHDDRTVTDEIAWRCIVASRRALRRGGELRLVANRHLGHHTRLRRVFGNCDILASDRRFVVLTARRP